jgi:tetratricopeptide (TPR) repeat protein
VSVFCLLLLASLFEPIVLAQEHQGCFARLSSEQLIDLNSLCERAGMENNSDSMTFQELYQQGFDQARRGLYREAIDTFNQAIQANPNEPMGFLARASAYLGINDSTSAVNDFEHAARIYRDQGDFEQERMIQASLKTLRR